MRYATYLKTFRKYYYLLTILVRRDVKNKYKGSVLGVLWSLLYPLLHMTVLTIVFSTLFNRTIENFPVYLLCGALLFNFFSTSTSVAMRSVLSSANLISKVYVPKYIITLSKIISGFIFFLISLIVLVIIMLLTKAAITMNILYVPIYLVSLFVFCSGVSLILATVTVFFRDIEHLYGVIITILMYASAIFYPADIIPDKYKIILTINPVYQYIKGFRDVVYYGISPEPYNLLICAVLAIVSIVIGVIVFEKNQDKFILHI